MRSRLMKTLSSLLLTIVLAAGAAVPAMAKDASVTYEGGAEKFVFLPGSDASGTDLFDNFKGVMPGDVLQQKITVKNDYKGCDRVKIYLRAETHKDDGSSLSRETKAAVADAVSMQDFLSQLSMKVKNGDQVIYEASPDELDGLKGNVLLGTFRYGEKAELTVELKVPAELGNAYADRTGEVDWVFVVEEINEKKSHHHSSSDDSSSTPAQNPTGLASPQTGDSSNIVLWAGLAAAALAAVIVLFCRKYRRREES